MAIDFAKTIPILRIFSVEKAQEFYTGMNGIVFGEPNLKKS